MQFSFTVNDATNANCKLLIDSGSGFEEKANKQAITGTHSFQLELVAGEYDWKISCEENGKTASTSANTFIVDESEEEVEIELLSAPIEYNFDNEGMESTLNQVLQTYDQMSAKERNLAEKLGYYKEAKNALKLAQRTKRDLNDIDFRTDLTDQEKEDQKKDMVRKANNAFANTVIRISVKDSKSFVKYAEEDEILSLLEDYVKHENSDAEPEDLLSLVNELQANIVVSTRASKLEIEKVSGEKQIITVIIKEVKSEDTPKSAYLLEYIPKEIASTADKITVLGNYEIVKEDPVLAFPLGDEIIYYVEKDVDLEKTKDTNTLLVKELKPGDLQAITGSATFLVPDLGGKAPLVILVLILILVYLFYGTSLGHMITSLVKASSKQVHYINVLINDAKQNMNAGNYEKAYMIYADIKAAFDSIPSGEQEKIFSVLINLVNMLDIGYSRQLSEKIEKAIADNNL
ncbi:hypothetical protein ACFL1B_04440, partial [Nanoarchaeota archaeon]